MKKNGDPGDATISVNRLLQRITIPIYPMYWFYMKEIKSIYDVMTKEAIQISNLLLKDGNEKSFTYGITYNSLGKKLFECFPDNRYKVYSESENIICDALFDKNGIVEGRAKIFYEEGLLDTGAGQAIVEAAGGKVTRYEDNERFYYNREDLLNGWFLVERS